MTRRLTLLLAILILGLAFTLGWALFKSNDAHDNRMIVQPAALTVPWNLNTRIDSKNLPKRAEETV